MRPAVPRSALQLVKAFRQGEFHALEKNLRIFGHLPEPTPNANGVTPVASLPNPFLPVKNPNTGRWREPKVSLRRQAELVKKAYATGTLDLLPPGPKKAAFEHRLQRLSAASRSPLDLLADAQAKLDAAKAQEAATSARTSADSNGGSREATTSEQGSNGEAQGVQWDSPVQWVGEFKPRKVAGSDLGTRLYSGKKRMFKLHLFERRRAKKEAKRAILLRDMPQRIQRFKQYHKKRRPHPLHPSFYTKAPKLPF